MITDQLSEHEEELEVLLPTTYPALARYGRNLTKEAQEDKLTPVAGWDEFVTDCIRILARRTKNNVALIEGSVADKLAIVEAVAQQIANGDVPDSLKDKKLIKLDLAMLITDTNSDSELVEKVEAIIREVKQAKYRIILFLEELPDIMDIGNPSKEISRGIKPAISRGEIQVLTTTTYEKYRQYLWQDAALEKRFQPLYEPDVKRIKPASSSVELEQLAQLSNYPLLARYGRDLTKEAQEGKLVPVAGWEDQVELCLQTMVRRTRSSAILIGGSHVDKLVIVEAVAQRMASGEVPESLKNKKLISLDLGAWLNGAESSDKFLERLQTVIEEIKQTQWWAFVFFEGLPDLLGAGDSDLDATQLLAPVLVCSEIVNLISTTTADKYRLYVDCRMSLQRKLMPILLDENDVRK